MRAASILAVSAVVALAAGCSSDQPQAIPVSTSTSTTTTTIPKVYTAGVASERQVAPEYRQGVARVDDGWIFSLNDGLFRTDNLLVRTQEVRPAIPPEWKAKGFDHLGDIDVAGDVVYAPLEQPEYAKKQQVMLMYDAATLTYQSAVEVSQQHNSFVTVDAETGIAYSMDEFGGQQLLRYDVTSGWTPLPPLAMSRFVDRVQGGDVYGGAVWLSTDDASEGVYRVDLAGGAVDALGSIGHADGEGEGIDATPSTDADLAVLSIDADIVTVRLIQMKVTAAPKR
jgi:hypothetical protein